MRYGQDRQALYQNVAGLEFKVCKNGPRCGGPVLLLQAKENLSGWDTEDYLMENIDVSESDIPRVVGELLDLPEDDVQY